MSNVLGEDVAALLEGAKHEVLIVAPFIRSEALGRLLDRVPRTTSVKVVTRWRLPELRAGVADLAIYDLLTERNATLLIRQDLHAKLFAADGRCLVGSANVTLAALGWRTESNLELLVPYDRTEEHVALFEQELLRTAVLASEELRTKLEDCLQILEEQSVAMPGISEETAALPPDWIPSIRNPEDLYRAYSGHSELEGLVGRAVRRELDLMGVPPGLNEETFDAWIAVNIRQTPLVAGVLQRVDTYGEVTETDVIELLGAIGGSPSAYQPRDVLEGLERWLSCFLNVQYETARDSIKLIRARRI
ncbi:MAG: hypothetical protein F4164_04705 [Gemmatimonadales bacterium]|nr:hypothetical protein [Gemmatimonadales bacterium]MYG48670.1 hypothetical protein [Gemmatimonadales bacterium]MYK02517.1 hypothetical protein [Candidatus Palauibacter ramosifaciens]